MSLESDPRIVGVGAAAAGASIATAVAGMIAPSVSLIVPAIGAVVALAAVGATGALRKPDKVLFDPAGHIAHDA